MIHKETIALLLLYVLIGCAVAWQLLMPGYILTLDMVTGQYVAGSSFEGDIGNTVVLAKIIEGMTPILPLWVFQKLLLLFIFTGGGVIWYTYALPKEKPLARIAGSLFFIANPFTYARIVAGHWLLLAGYSLLPLVWHTGKAAYRRPTTRSLCYFAAVIVGVSLVSTHMWVLVVCMVAAAIKLVLIGEVKRVGWQAAKSKMITGAILIAITLLVNGGVYPELLNKSGVLSQIAGEDGRAYQTQGEVLGVVSEFITLNGFWGQATTWGQSYVWPGEMSIPYMGLMMIAFIIAGGIILAQRQERRNMIIWLGVALVGIVCASMGSVRVASPLYDFMANTVPWIKGFRESQKFLAITGGAYAMLFTWGASVMLSKSESKTWHKNTIIVLMFIAPLFTGWTMWAGLRGQLQVVQYPSSWHEARKEMQSRDGAVLILPWHGYYSLSFNKDRIVANPARTFFGPQAVYGKSTDLPGSSPRNESEDYRALNTALQEKTKSEIIDILQEQNIRYILDTGEVSKNNRVRENITGLEGDVIYKNEGVTIKRVNDL